MSFRALVARLSALGRRTAIDTELAEEIGEHLRLAAEEKEAAGLSPRDALAAARREFGNPTLARESSSGAWGWPAIDTLAADVRFGARMLRKHWIASAVAAGALGIAVGVTSGVVSLLDELLHHEYPYAAPERIVLLWAKRPAPPRFDQLQVSLAELRVWQRAARQTTIAGFSWTQSVNISTGAAPSRAAASLVTSNLLSTLGVTPTLGRDFTAADERDDTPNTAIVTYDFWKNELGGSGAALTTSLVIDREPYAIVGVLPPSFRMPILLNVKILLPARHMTWTTDRTARSIVPIGRLAPGATGASAAAELDPITASFNRNDPKERGEWATNVEDFHRSVGRHVRQSLGALFGTSLVVLLIACANVAILLLARIPARRQELTVRLALGAERRRLVAQLFVESALLACIAAVIGIGLSRPTMGILFRLFSGSIPFEWHPAIDLRVTIVAVAIAAVTCLAFGVAPVVSVVRSLRADGALSGARTGRAVEQAWLRAMLIATEVALSLMLIVGGWLMVERVLVIEGRRIGFDSRDLVTARILLDTARYRTPAARLDFYETLRARLAGHRELRDATIASNFPLGNTDGFANYVTRQAMTDQDRPDTVTGTGTAILPNYFAAMHVPIVEGRTIGDRETEPVVVVNEQLAHEFWPGESAVGKRLQILEPMYADGESVAAGERVVIGVSRNVRASPLMADDAWPTFFMPVSQQPARAMTIAVRAPTSAAAASAMRSEISAIDPLLPIYGVRSVPELMDYWLGEAHLNAMILELLSGIGVALTLIGIYSVVAVFVSQRTREIGIRIAVGAQRGAVVRLIVRRTLWPAAVGLVVGTGLAMLGTHGVASMLSGVSLLEPRAYAGGAAVLIVVVASAAFLPARRAARLDPIRALRTE